MQALKDNLITILFIAVLAIVALAVFLSSGSSTEDSRSSKSSSVLLEGNGRMTDYNEAAFNSASESKKVLFFHAEWCIVCKQIERNFESGALPDDTVVFIVDLEGDRDLVREYDIRFQTSFVQVDDNGNELKQWNWLQMPSANGQDLLDTII